MATINAEHGADILNRISPKALQCLWEAAKKRSTDKLRSVPTAARTIILLAFLFPYYKPAIIHHIDFPYLYELFLFLKIGVSTISIAAFLLVGKRSIFVLLSFALCSYTLAITLFLNGNLLMWMDQFYAPFGAVCLVFAVYRFWGRQLLYAIATISSIMLACTLASAFLFPGGIWAPERYFYGNKNSVFLLALPSLGCTLELDAIDQKQVSHRTLMIGALSAISVFVLKSTTSSIAFLFLVIVTFLGRRGFLKKFITGITILLFYLIAFFAVVIFRLQEHLGGILSFIFGKESSLSGRTSVWDATFSQGDWLSALFGHGTTAYGYINFDGMMLDAHNQVLHIWYTDGAIGVLLFLALISFASYRLYQSRSSFSAAVWCALLGAFLIVGIAESDPYCQFYLILALAGSGFWRYATPAVSAKHAASEPRCQQREPQQNSSTRRTP